MPRSGNGVGAFSITEGIHFGQVGNHNGNSPLWHAICRGFLHSLMGRLIDSDYIKSRPEDFEAFRASFYADG